MKKQEQQEIPDELKAINEAQKVSYLKNVWVAIYGPLKKKEEKVKGRTRCTYNWKAQPFDNVSSFLRREITSQLIKTDTMFDENDSSLRDEFYNRIYVTLNQLLDDNQCFADTLYDVQYITKSVNELTTPIQDKVKEFLIWHNCGLPVSLKEKRLLKQCLKKFLNARPRTEKATARIYREKMKEIYAESATLLKKAKYFSKKLVDLYAESVALRDVNEDDERVISYKKREKAAIKKYLKIGSRCIVLCRKNALSTSYNVLYGNFPTLENKLLNANR